MFDDPQLDVDEAPKGAQYKVGDMVFTCDNDFMLVDEVVFVGDKIIGIDFDRGNPVNYDYLLVTKEGDEYWYSYAQIEHKANHMKEVYHG